MNLQQIDAVTRAYAGRLDEADLARIGFFRGIWEIQAKAEDLVEQGGPYQLPDIEDLDRWYWDEERSIFSQAPVAIDAPLMAQTARQIAAYIASSGSFDAAVTDALAQVDWEALLAGAGDGKAAGTAGATLAELAGSDPAAFLEAAYAELSSRGEEVAAVGAMVLSLALRAMLEPAQQAIGSALHRRVAGEYILHRKPLRCPCCASEATLAYVGPTDASDGNGRRLHCSQCGCDWEFERIRCPRCGTRREESLRYVSLEGDDAHRLYVCDECGGYVRTRFVDPATLLPFSPEVEDVVMATLDAVAQDLPDEG